MKYILLLLSLFAYQASATMIDLDSDKNSYLTNESALLDININSMLAGAAELELEIAFDPASLAFDLFDLAPGNGVFIDFANASAGKLTLNTWWFSSFDVPSTPFALGQVWFTALTDVTPVFSVISVNQYDEFGTLIPTTQVNEPTSILIILTAFVLLLRRLAR